MSGSKPPAPTAMTAVPQHVPTMIMSDSPSTHNGSPGWAAAAPPAGWSGRSASPAAPGWGGRAASPATAGWGTGTTPAGKTSAMWTPQWGATGSPAANGGTMGLAGDTNITSGAFYSLIVSIFSVSVKNPAFTFLPDTFKKKRNCIFVIGPERLE